MRRNAGLTDGSFERTAAFSLRGRHDVTRCWITGNSSSNRES
jgi:hypothetical protein